MDEQRHGQALTLLIVIPAIYALVKEFTIGRASRAAAPQTQAAS